MRILKLLLFASLFFVFPFAGKGQIRYTLSDYADAGQNFLLGHNAFPDKTIHIDDFLNGEINLSDMQPERTDTVFFLKPEQTGGGKYFKEANLAMRYSSKYILYLKKNPDGIREIGYNGDYLDIAINVIFGFHDNPPLLRFPFKEGRNFQTRVKRDLYTANYATQSMDSVRKIIDIRRTIEIRSNYKVHTPYKSYKTILVVTKTQNNYKGFTYSSFGWTPKKQMSGKDEFAEYAFYAGGKGYPVARFLTGPEGYVRQLTYQVERPLSIRLRKRDVTCQGGNNGQIDLEIDGGIPYYDIQWSNEVESEDQLFLTAGWYKVRVRDNRGKQVIDSIRIEEPDDPMWVNIRTTPETCYHDFDGRASVAVSGGYPPYEITWKNGLKDSVLQGLKPGKYPVRVSDTKGCTKLDTAVITGAKRPLDVWLEAQDNVCKGGKEGSIQPHVQGGIKPYTYQWSHGDTAAHPQDLPAGYYSLSLHDAHGCTDTAGTAVRGPEVKMESELIAYPVACHGMDNGAAYLLVQGGKPSYSYSWSDGETGWEHENLAPGKYTATAKDRIGCKHEHEFLITEPQPLRAEFNAQRPQANMQGGSLAITAGGGRSPYRYHWDNGQDQAKISHLGPGHYTVQLEDAFSCSTTFDYKLHAAQNTAIPADSLPRHLGQRFNLQRENLFLALWGPQGQRLIKNKAVSQFFPDGWKTLSPGHYHYEIRNASGELREKGHFFKEGLIGFSSAL